MTIDISTPDNKTHAILQANEAVEFSVLGRTSIEFRSKGSSQSIFCDETHFDLEVR